MQTELNPQSIIVKTEDFISSKIHHETIMMSVSNGKYYSFAEVGSSIWSNLNEPILIEDLCKKLLNEFDVTYEDCLRDTLEFLKELYREKIIETKS